MYLIEVVGKVNSIYSQEKLNEERIKGLLDQASGATNDQNVNTSSHLSTAIRSLLNAVMAACYLGEHWPLKQHLIKTPQDYLVAGSIVNR